MKKEDQINILKSNRPLEDLYGALVLKTALLSLHARPVLRGTEIKTMIKHFKKWNNAWTNNKTQKTSSISNEENCWHFLICFDQGEERIFDKDVENCQIFLGIIEQEIRESCVSKNQFLVCLIIVITNLLGVVEFKNFSAGDFWVCFFKCFLLVNICANAGQFLKYKTKFSPEIKTKS